MSLLISPTYFEALCRLVPGEQARANDFVLAFQKNPAMPGISLERAAKAKSHDVWSARVSRDLRAILHKDRDTWALLFVAHHDEAYRWAERRDVGRHPTTGALQVVETVESVREATLDLPLGKASDTPSLLEQYGDEFLLCLGVPADWLPLLRTVIDEDQLLAVIQRLPDDVAERLFQLVAGEVVTPPQPIPPSSPATDAPDTRSRFYIVDDGTELSTILDAPMERWIAFLHPSQRGIVEANFIGPAKVSGSAGTGKTVVAMHRARRLASEGQRVLVTSFVRTLCENIDRNLRLFCTATELANITVSTIHSQALALVRKTDPAIQPVDAAVVRERISAAAARHDSSFDESFVQTEWDSVVKRQGAFTWEGYRKARRIGRGRPLSARDRKALWTVFEDVLAGLRDDNLLDWAMITDKAARLLLDGQAPSPYDAVVVDEVQDLTPPDLVFVRAMTASRPGNLLLVGDAGQRIFPGGFSLSALGIEVRGRASILRINYRTTEQIRRSADQILSDTIDDLDGGTERRSRTRSLLGGPAPRLRRYANQPDEISAVVSTVRSWLAAGLPHDGIAVFSRAGSLLTRVRDALESANIPCHSLARPVAHQTGAVQLGTMHRAKGLEFRAVTIAGCSANELPDPRALRAQTDPQDREEAEALERRLLYVAMTRARDELVLTWVGEPSHFLKPLLP